MQRLRLVSLALAVTALASVGVAACGDDDDDGGGDGGGGESLDLVIGNIFPQTGALASFSPAFEKGAQLALDEVNAAIEETGADHTVEALAEDDQTDPQAGVQAARKLAGEDVSCFNGAAASSSTIAITESVSTREGILQISPAVDEPGHHRARGRWHAVQDGARGHLPGHAPCGDHR